MAPAEQVSLDFDTGLVDRLLDDVGDEPGKLPLMEFALKALWEARRGNRLLYDIYKDMGGVQGAIAKRAETVYAKLSPMQQEATEQVFIKLVRPSDETGDARRRAELREFDPAGQALINTLAGPQARLLIMGRDTGTNQENVEVAHEALFSHWGKLQRWLSERRDDIRFQLRLEDAADEWYRQQNDPMATGLLWRPPLLSLLRDYHEAHSHDMRKEDLTFYEASKKAYQREIDKEQARTKLLRNFAIVMGIVAALAIGVSGFFAFATIHGLDPGETATALMIRAGLKPVPVPEMIKIQPGTGDFPASYRMGSDSDRAAEDERPAHMVIIETPFAMGRYEVTFEQYDAFVEATHGTNRPDDKGWGRDSRPVINVSWDDATAYAKWLGAVTGKHYRLPTEAEWEYAARAGTETSFSTGDCIHTDQASYGGYYDYNDCGANTGVVREKTVPTGSLPPNPWSLHEMHGNVWEWVQDCWHGSYEGEGRPDDGSAWEAAGGGNCDRRVVRGGSWVDVPRILRSAFRTGGGPGERDFNLGFRLAQDVK